MKIGEWVFPSTQNPISQHTYKTPKHDNKINEPA